MTDVFAGLRARIASNQAVHRVGRIREIGAGVIVLSGLSTGVGLGDRVMLCVRGQEVGGEVLRLSAKGLVILPDGPIDGAAIDDKVRLVGRAEVAPDMSWIGRIIDPFGQPLDGRPLFSGPHPYALRIAAPPAATRRLLGERLETGVAAFNTLLPLVRGQRLGLFAGSGVGKSSLLGQFARGVAADIVVIALVGERGREVREFTDHTLGAEGMARSVVIAATSDQSPLTRRRCLWAAMATAEYFRDRGLHVLLLADSITRFAEAHREIALAAGEEGSLRGFPPSTSQTIMGLAERAGPGRDEDGCGDITAIFTVLVAGSDMDEPVADILRGVLDGHVVLDREIAERGRFPAVDLLRSVSRSLPKAASDEENKLISKARKLLGAWSRAELMVQAGLYAKGSDPLIDAAIRVWPDLDKFMGRAAKAGITADFEALATVLAPAGTEGS
jgi:flagellum-specific ATP synthase